MPLYLYSSPDDENEYIEVFQGMNEEHKFIDPQGREWKRLYCAPQLNIDTKLDPNSSKDFVRYTGARTGTLGEMQDLSSAMSQARADKNGGVDPVMEKLLDERHKRTGMVPFERKKKMAQEKLDKMGIVLK